MSKIYSDADEELHKLLGRASNESGATLLIPDLQRPYVWSPAQVVLLLDSLIRGWPFGTLLLWDVHQDDLSRIPSRPFWRVVDRTGDESGTQVTQQNPPATFHMVLDGQQRIQSLVLALCGDSWGFKMSDKDWHIALGTRAQRGKGKHWSLGTLCIDLDELVRDFSTESGIPGIDFTRVLRWVVTDQAGGRSKPARPAKYENPLPTNFSDEGKGRYIRLSRIWERAPAKEGLEPEHIERLLNPVLDEHSVPASKVTEVMRPLRSLTQAFSRVKLTRVNYLRVERFDSAIQTEDSYNDSVVGIFTRLNTAGRTLSREEITFAWLKVGWTRERTGGRGAAECFKSLLSDLQAENLREALVLDDVVAGASFAWAVNSREGSLLSDRDLLKKDIIQPMADDLSATWGVIHDSFCRVAESMKERKIEFRDHFQSLNAFWILCTWRMIAESQLSRFSNATTAEKANYQAEIDRALEENLDRWFLCSSWAGRWAKASGQIMAGYAARLAALIRNLKNEDSLEGASLWISDFLESEVKDFVGEAVAEIERLGAESRDQVRSYYSYLWVWHRLDAERWSMSSVPLRESAKKKTSIDVDHVVSVALWQKLPSGKSATDGEGIDPTDSESAVHGLGNMLLLEKSFNISKGERPLGDFLDQLSDFSSGRTNYNDWIARLLLHCDHGRPVNKTRCELLALFEARESAMKQDLVSFAKGVKRRCDL